MSTPFAQVVTTQELLAIQESCDYKFMLLLSHQDTPCSPPMLGRRPSTRTWCRPPGGLRGPPSGPSLHQVNT